MRYIIRSFVLLCMSILIVAVSFVAIAQILPRVGSSRLLRAQNRRVAYGRPRCELPCHRLLGDFGRCGLGGAQEQGHHQVYASEIQAQRVLLRIRGSAGLIEDDTSGGAGHAWAEITLESDTRYKYVLKLVNDSDATVIESSVTVRTLAEDSTSASSTDASLSNLTLSGVGAFRPFSFRSSSYNYTATTTNSVTQTTVTPYREPLRSELRHQAQRHGRLRR